MRTIKQVEEEVKEIEHRLKTEELKKSVSTKLRKKIQYLRHCIMYIETSPSPAYMKEEIKKVETKIGLRMAQFVLEGVEAMPKSVVSKLKREHEKKYEVPKLREQIKTLRYILKN